MKVFTALTVAALTAGVTLASAAITPTNPVFGDLASIAQAQQQTVTVPAPAGVPNGWYAHMFHNGWGQSYRVTNGTVTIQGWDLGSVGVFLNFGNEATPQASTQWYKPEDQRAVPSGFAALIYQGQLLMGDQNAASSAGPFAANESGLILDIETDGVPSGASLSCNGTRATLTLPSLLNSFHVSAGSNARPDTGLPTGGPNGLVNTNQVLSLFEVYGVVERGADAVTVSTTQSDALQFSLETNGRPFQFGFGREENGEKKIFHWTSIGRLQADASVTLMDGNAPAPVGPFAAICNTRQAAVGYQL